MKQTQVYGEVSPLQGPDSKTFNNFDIGDFLLSESGNVGVKIAKDSVRWIIRGSLSNRENDGYNDHSAVTTGVSQNYRYLVPAKVVVMVSR